MKIAIFGASGFLGSHLTEHLLRTTNHSLVLLSRDTSTITLASERVTTHDINVFDDAHLAGLLEGCDAVYYFVHMMGQKGVDFYEAEHLAAERFSAAAKTAGVHRIIYMGGLGNDNEQLSKHLLSRHNTGTVLRDLNNEVVEFRASMIVAPGSLSFDVISNLVNKLPIMLLPKWAKTRTQPIALSDALSYLTAAIDIKIPHSVVVEIGGSTVLSYIDLYKYYAKFMGKKRLTLRLSFIPHWLGGGWLNLFMPANHARIGMVMADSLRNEMIVTDAKPAQQFFPAISPKSLEDALLETKQLQAN